MEEKFDARCFTSDRAIITYLFIAKIFFHLLNPEYGYFRDELYYLAIGDNFDFGNLDILPLTPLYYKLITAVFGYSIKALHFGSSLCGAFSLVLACLIAKELGGKRYAVLLTGLSVFFSGYLIFGALFTYDCLDFLLQTLLLYLLVKIVKGDKQRLWILFGLVLGLGLLNKLSILIFGAALFLSLLLRPQRVYFKRVWIWLAGLIALVFLVPFVIWQSHHNWYYLNFIAGYSGGVAYQASFLEFLWGQILPNNIFGMPIWVTGLILLLFSSSWKRYRLFGLMYVIVFFLAFFLGVKFYFTIPMYSILLAVGSVRIEDYLQKRAWQKNKKLLAHIALPVLYVILSMPLLPMIVPLLPVEQFIQYASVLGVTAGVRHENTTLERLPQHVADRFGWEEMADQIADAYKKSSRELDEDIGIITENYGEAGAVHLFGKKYNLPEPICFNSWFYFEALRHHRFKNVYISIGLSPQQLSSVFQEVAELSVFTHPYVMPYENNDPICLCRNPRYDLRRYWLVLRRIDPGFMNVLRREGVEAAVSYYDRSQKANPAVILFTEQQMNTLGYDYLNRREVKEAIGLFLLNVKAYPDAFNTYDSLGEAYMNDGQYDAAVENYRKSLALNPQNSNATAKLEELAKLMKGGEGKVGKSN